MKWPLFRPDSQINHLIAASDQEKDGLVASTVESRLDGIDRLDRLSIDLHHDVTANYARFRRNAVSSTSVTTRPSVPAGTFN